MYLPYLRGKQFELLALRELATLPLDAAKISPIIEPVKKNLKNIGTAISYLNRLQIGVQLIINPEHGELKDDTDLILGFLDGMILEGLTTVTPTFLISSDKDFENFKIKIVERGYENSGYSLIHLNQISKAAELKTIASSTNLVHNIIDVRHLIALRRGYPSNSVAFLSDPFNKQKKNADYNSYLDEVFSSDYFYYKGEGFNAFSDYLTIGGEYIEGGMLPYAVVIHLTYKDKHNDEIRIRHFLSDSNTDTSDTAGKFYEALQKLIAFVDSQDVDSIAIRQFRDYYKRGAYPGLGILKKLSIMHHIELVQGLI